MKILKLLTVCLALAQANLSYAEDLLTVYQQALEADPELKTAELKVEIGAAQKGQALGQMLPQINANANWSANNQRLLGAAATPAIPATPTSTSNYHGTRYTIALSQTLLDFEKFWTWRHAQEIENQYASENIEAQHALMFNVVEKYFDVLDAEDQLTLVQAEKETTIRQLEQVQKQYAKQLVLITDLYEVEARLDQIKADEIEAETILVTARESLKELTNTTPVALYKLRDEIEYKELEGALDNWIEVAKSENPTLAAQLSAIAAAGNDVAAQKSKYMPVVDLQLNYYSTNTGFNSVNLGRNVETQVAAINVNVPLFTGGTTTNKMYEAQHKLSISKYENEAKIRALIKETSDSFLSSNANVRRISATRKALASAIKSRESMESGFRYGVQTISDVLDAQQDEFRSRRDLSQAKYSYIKNKMRFLKAVGLISEENMVEVNNWLQVMPKQAEKNSDKQSKSNAG
ncbi:MAG: TolC family outer membrane protein [Methylococcaceae bacterium]